MFNHSAQHNVGFVLDRTNDTINYYATKDIATDEELCINYGPYLWFTSIDSADSTLDSSEENSADSDPDANENKWLYSK